MLLELGAGAIAEKIVPMLLPLLPHLWKGAKAASEKFAEALGEKSVKAAVDVAEKIWGKLKPKVDETPSAEKLIQKAAENPTQAYLPGALTYEFTNLLEDQYLRKEIAEIIAKGEKDGAKIESFIEAGEIYGEVTGVKVLNLDALEKAGLITSEIKAKFVGKGGKVVGVTIGN